MDLEAQAKNAKIQAVRFFNEFKEVEKFFSTMPKLSHTIEVTNPNTKKKSKIVLEGLADFFG